MIRLSQSELALTFDDVLLVPRAFDCFAQEVNLKTQT